MNRLFFTLIMLTFFTTTFGQSLMVVGQKHTIFVDVPKNWLQAKNDQLRFFIKPNQKRVSDETYMYVYGIDYNSNPDLNAWVKGNNDYISKTFKDVKIDTLKQEFENIIATLGELKNLPNAKLIEMMDKLSVEFEVTKSNIINTTYHLDKVEDTYNRILKEFDSRN